MKKCLFCENFVEDNVESCPKCGSAKFVTTTEIKSVHSNNVQAPATYSPDKKTASTPSADIIGELDNTSSLNKNVKKPTVKIILSIATAMIVVIAIIICLTVFPFCNHEYISEITLEPTIYSTGTTEYHCKKCDNTYTEELPALPKTEENLKLEKQRTCNHNYTERVVKEPTYSTPGDMRYYCSKCKHAYNEEIAVLPTVLEVTVTDKLTSERPGNDQNFVNFIFKVKNITDSSVSGFKGKLHITTADNKTLTLFCDFKDNLIPSNYTITITDYGYEYYKYSLLTVESAVANADFNDLQCWFEVTKIY